MESGRRTSRGFMIPAVFPAPDSISLHWIFMRLFTAIDLLEEMREKLGNFLARLRPLAKLRWSRVENLHITTKFIGEWPEGRLDEMKSALKGVSGGPIQIAVWGVGWFPDAERARVFWTGVEGGEPLARLACETEQAVAELGVFQASSFFLYLSANGKCSKLAEFSLTS